SLHRHIARELARLAVSAREVASHLARTVGNLPPWAVTWILAADDAQLPDAEAIDLLRRALAGLEPMAAERTAVAGRLCHMLFQRGRDREMVAVGGSVLPDLGADDAACRLRMEMLRSYLRLGRYRDASTVGGVAGQAGLPPVWRARLGAWLGLALTLLDATAEAEAAARAALAVAEQLGDGYAIAAAHNTLAAVGPAGQRVAHLDAGLAVPAHDPDSIELRALLLGSRGAWLSRQRAGAGDPSFTEALRLAEGTSPYARAATLALVAEEQYRVGRWDEALATIGRIEPLGSAPLAYLGGLRALIAYRRDQRGVGGTALRHPPHSGGPFVAEVAAMRAEVAGDADRALAIRAGFLDLTATGVWRCGHEALFLVRSARAAGRHDLAGRALGRLTGPGTPATAWDRLVLRCCRAMIGSDGDEMSQVATAFEQGGWTPYAAFAYEETAAAYAGTDDAGAARSALRAAVQNYRALGAEWEIRRAGARLRALGVRLGVRTAHRRARAGWPALTDGELRVVRLAAAGLSNPDIARALLVSRSTVQTQVSSALRKLGLRSRLELARAVRARDGMD
ncbi:MAG TPA: helix-turn-helix transcriptional regulator, partial [Rugosimonospora sp.]|nr:helix-turn-helix transcriptional regulator [Rugosimonospora sp.]